MLMKRLTLFLITLSVAALSHAAVRLPSIISDHMVLQADTAAPIWGWADPGEEVSITFADQTKTAKADKAGAWSVKLNDLKPGSTGALTVKGASTTVTIQDVLVGEVWLGSGQSNMAMTVTRAKDYEQEQAAANLPQIRMFIVEKASMTEPQKDCKGSWQVCSPETVGQFSATAYFFGRELHRELKVPVGLINSSWGGTAIEAWTSMEAQSKLPEYKTISEPWEQLTSKPWDAARAEADYQTKLTAWKAEVEKAKAAKKPLPRRPQQPVAPQLQQNHPANLFNGMISPIIPYAFRGAVWYQGEANSAKPFSNLYGLQLKTMIEDWRKRFGHDFPFAWVQLPNYRAAQQSAVETQRWPVIREQMLQTLSVPRTGMAIAMGLGEADNIHPKNKQGVGKRLSFWALHDVYGKKDVVTSGPLPAKHEIKGSNITITFDHAEGGLRSTQGGAELKGFAIAGENRRFVWARARIVGNKVVVSSPNIPEPKAVRYAWADNPVWSLENAAGLPASPFRTDDWKVELRLPAIFSDHMVVQSDALVPVWGWADAGDQITVTLGDQTATTTAVSDGSWRVRLGKLKASAEPQKLVVKGRTTITVNDVLVGEVWLASGQSNMAFLFSRGQYPAEESAAANLPQLRMFKVAQNSSRTPQKDCEGTWVVSTPEAVQDFSAVAYYFGRDLHQKLQVPVGMINSSWGGTDIAAWTSESKQAAVPALKSKLDEWAQQSAAFDAVKAKALLDQRDENWKKAVAKAKADKAPTLPPKPRAVQDPAVSQNHPANLFNGMISPIIPYALRGAIWYQGEHNCATLEKAQLYSTQLPLLIEDWRAQWRSKLPFAWVQLPGFERSPYRPQVREAMLKSLSVPNTGMAITVDVGEAKDNHPKNKKAVGERLSLWALARVYRQKVPAFSGPLPAGHEITGSQVHLKFDQTQSGLKAHGDKLTGFQIAGADKQWKPAEARINAREVIVSSPDVKQPVAVRYGWAEVPDGNLFNGAGLPASPFRTDDWEAPVVPEAQEPVKKAPTTAETTASGTATTQTKESAPEDKVKAAEVPGEAKAK